MSLTVTGFEQLEAEILQSPLPPTVGFTLALWRLQELLKGYRYAIDHGYSE